ncbi:MAG: beta-ketoacyl-[acyl-carrier-protein] synthase family protein [Fibrobacterota bacterium]
MNRDVVITGAGAVSSLGCDVETFWKNICAGTNAAAPIPRQWEDYSSFRSSLWAPLGEEARSLSGKTLTRMDAMRMDPSTRMAVHAAAQALENAGISHECIDRKAGQYRLDGVDPARSGVFMGTGVGGATTLIDTQRSHTLQSPARLIKELREGESGNDPHRRELYEQLEEQLHRPKRFNPFVVSMIMPNAPAAHLSIRFSCAGPVETNTTACASGTIAPGRAFRSIQRGECDFALAGGTEYLGDSFGGIFRGFDTAGTLTDIADPARANRPFDADRRGFLFAEGGAAVLTMESRDHAERRGASILCSVSAYAESSDAHNIMMPRPDGRAVAGMIKKLLATGNIAPQEIGYINAHGTGTIANDDVESAVIADIFGRTPAVNSSKSLLGHTIGAAGALEAVITALSLRDQRIHGSRNAQTPPAGIRIQQETADAKIRHALSQSFAFGGNNAALLLSQEHV